MILSKRLIACPDDPMLHYQAIALAAQRAGRTVLRLDHCQPDQLTSEVFYTAAGAFMPQVLGYAPFAGLGILTESLQGYYRLHGMNYALDDILVTSGASEALLFTLQCILDPGSEVLVPEPFYSSYRPIIAACGGQLRPVFTTPEEDYCYAVREKLIPLIGSQTRAILCSNPCNPTGAVLTHAQMQVLADVAREYGLWLIVDEVYRDFVYDAPVCSFGQLSQLEQQLVLLDSASKRFSACGARVGALITRNRELMHQARRLAQARLSVATLDQVAAAELYLMDEAPFAQQRQTLRTRRDLCLAALRDIPGVHCVEPKGAFYLMAHLPVDSADRFQQWLLEEFEDDGQTLLFAPGSCFYCTPGCGQREVRISFLLPEQLLCRAMHLLAQALRRYPGTLRMPNP